MVLRVWQLVLTAALVALAAGLLLGRYAVPAGAGPKGVRFDLPNGQGAIYVPNKTMAEQLKRDGDESQAQSNVRAAVPAIEAWNADHGVYTGATLGRLQASYDAGISDVVVESASSTDYCLQSTVGTVTYSKHGPAGEVVRGSC